MQIEKTKQLFLILSFLAIIFIEGVTLLAIQLLQGVRPTVAGLFCQLPSQQNLRAYEIDLEDGSWFVKRLRPFMQSMRFLILDDLGKKAIQGKDGWLFYDLDVRYLTERFPKTGNPEPPGEAMLHSVLSFQKRLGERGIHLLLIPAPGKPGIYPDKLTNRASDSAACINSNTLILLSRLQDEGVEVVNLFDIFRAHTKDVSPASSEHLFLTQDTHWSPAGMKLAATSVAERLLQLGWTEKGEENYDLKPVNLSRFGDVLRMSRIQGIEKRFTPEIIETTQVVNSTDKQPYADDPTSDILVLGDSFLRIYERDEPKSGGFVAHLARELKKPLSSIINDGGASTLVRQELYRKPNLLTGKKVVLWEFVERDIRFGTEGWQDVPLPSPILSAR